jgi:hypothetical protein
MTAPNASVCAQRTGTVAVEMDHRPARRYAEFVEGVWSKVKQTDAAGGWSRQFRPSNRRAGKGLGQAGIADGMAGERFAPSFNTRLRLGPAEKQVRPPN